MVLVSIFDVGFLLNRLRALPFLLLVGFAQGPAKATTLHDLCVVASGMRDELSVCYTGRLGLMAHLQTAQVGTDAPKHFGRRLLQLGRPPDQNGSLRLGSGHNRMIPRSCGDFLPSCLGRHMTDTVQKEITFQQPCLLHILGPRAANTSQERLKNRRHLLLIFLEFLVCFHSVGLTAALSCCRSWSKWCRPNATLRASETLPLFRGSS